MRDNNFGIEPAQPESLDPDWEKRKRKLTIALVTRCNAGFLLVTSNSLNLLSKGEIKVLTRFPYYNNFDVLVNGENAYVLSSAGIFLADVNEICENKEYTSQLLNVNYGLESSITANSWNFADEDGTLFISCTSGIFRYEPPVKDGAEQEYKFGISHIVCDGTRIYPENGVFTIPKETWNVTIQGVVCNYSLNMPMVRFYEEGNAAGDIVPYSDMSPIMLNRPASGVHNIRFQIYDSSGKTLLKEGIFKVIKESQT